MLRACPFLIGVLAAAAPNLQFKPGARTVPRFETHEVVIESGTPTPNPFRDTTLTADLTLPDGTRRTVEGFADSADGRVYRIRFMPVVKGRHSYTVHFIQGRTRKQFEGAFLAVDSKLPGIVEIDPQHPYHFQWSGSGEHYFYNGTTAYWILGIRDDREIEAILDRLARHGINRIRVALNGRTASGARWKEDQVKPDAGFQLRLEPWPAARPLDIENPGYDIARFNLDHYRKAERLLAAARSRNIVVSLIFHLDGADKGVDPFGKANMGGEDEQRYYRYTVARLGAYPNLMWDVTNEWHLFRDEAWTNRMGALIREHDPYRHLISVHGNSKFPYRLSPWAGFAMYQSWDEHGSYDFMLKNRREQQTAGRPIPQVNEEYGYEDHYPYPWGEGRRSPARVADTRRRLAWEMALAGGYQTTGERANEPGMGGWINGRGNAAMVLPSLHAHLLRFMTSLPWWTADPHPELAAGAALCLADPARLYIVYRRRSGDASVELAPGAYSVRAFNPRTGESHDLPAAQGGRWNVPQPGSGEEDWAFSLRLQ